jgi:hypothetical protein
VSSDWAKTAVLETGAGSPGKEGPALSKQKDVGHHRERGPGGWITVARHYSERDSRLAYRSAAVRRFFSGFSN